MDKNMDYSLFEQETISTGARVVFFSDAHLEPDGRTESTSRSDKIIRFLQAEVKDKCQCLVIMGDLFDFYFEYGSVVPAGFVRIVSALKEITASGISAFYCAGNHDFWLGPLFEQTTGVKICRDGLLISRQDDPGKLFAIHGDGLGSGDTGYKILKACLRNPILIKAFRLIHPDLGYKIAGLTSHTSRKHTGQYKNLRSETLKNVAQEIIRTEKQIDKVVFAHTHTPLRESLDGGEYLNTGDWCEHFSYGVWDKNTISLKFFE